MNEIPSNLNKQNSSNIESKKKILKPVSQFGYMRVDEKTEEQIQEDNNISNFPEFKDQ